MNLTESVYVSNDSIGSFFLILPAGDRHWERANVAGSFGRRWENVVYYSYVDIDSGIFGFN